jgi:four helix bundle protein
MKIEKFEDLEIWQEAREISKMVFKLTNEKSFDNDYRFKYQMRDAAGSTMDNIAEGFGRGGNKEFNNFLSIAKGSNEEVRSQSYRTFDYHYISEDTYNDLLERTDRLSRKIKIL